MENIFEYPLDTRYILRKKNALLRELREKVELKNIRIAVLGGSSTQDIVKLMDLFLLDIGYRAEFFESDFNRYYETVMFSEELTDFNPDFIYIHTNIRNLKWKPEVDSKEMDLQDGIDAEIGKLREMVSKIQSSLNATIIVNNIEYPQVRVLGNYDAVHLTGLTRYIRRLNDAIACYVETKSGVLLMDINYIASLIGLDVWYDEKMWCSFSYGMSLEGQVHMAKNLSNLIRASLGDAAKCIAVDLDNTLWGGIIGDDGIDGIHIGSGSPTGIAHQTFQEYLKSMYKRGITLTVCSKNEEDIAREGLMYKGMILGQDDFALIKANWKPKDENILEIAKLLNIGVANIVFVDDNPVEREIVKANIVKVSVPDIGSDPTRYALHIDRNGYFETVGVSNDDIKRNSYYRGNQQRQSEQKAFENYSDYLKSLEMTAQITLFKESDMERIGQLTNKTNQFNMTTLRMKQTEVDAYRTSDSKLGLSARLSDKYGDNGLISVLAGTFEDDVFKIDLWLMSCRVFKRDLEYLLFSELVHKLKQKGVKIIRGVYRPTDRNRIIHKLYDELGFRRVEESATQTIYEVELASLTLKTIDYITLNGGE